MQTCCLHVSGQPQIVLCQQVAKEDLRKLFIHGIPQSAQPADLLQLFEACTCAHPTVEGDMKERRGTVLCSSVHLDLAPGNTSTQVFDVECGCIWFSCHCRTSFCQ